MGGPVDPETGEVVWEFHVPLEQQLLHYQGRPPSCLETLRSTPAELPGFVFDGHGEPVNAIFAVACTCGGTRFTATASRHDDDDWPQPPVELWCEKCDLSYEVFDADKHGFDGVMSGRKRDAVDSDEAELNHHPCEVLVRFEFPSDHLGDDEYQGIEHDLFSWITIVGKDSGGRLVTLFDYECA